MENAPGIAQGSEHVTAAATRFRRKRGKRGGVKRHKPFSKLTLAEREELYDVGLRRAELAALARIPLKRDERGRILPTASCPSAARLPTEMVVDFHDKTARSVPQLPRRSSSDDDAFDGLLSSDEDEDDNTNLPDLTAPELAALREPTSDDLRTASHDVLVSTVLSLRSALRKYIAAYTNSEEIVDAMRGGISVSPNAEDPRHAVAANGSSAAALAAADLGGAAIAGAHAGVKRTREARVLPESEDPTNHGATAVPAAPHTS